MSAFLYGIALQWKLDIRSKSPVSYTHLDVYKRQAKRRPCSGKICWPTPTASGEADFPPRWTNTFL